MAVNRGCPDYYTYCKPLCGLGCEPHCEPKEHRICSTYIKNHKEELPELYKLICQT